jgi:hypothetical protein
MIAGPKLYEGAIGVYNGVIIRSLPALDTVSVDLNASARGLLSEWYTNHLRRKIGEI